MVRRKYPGQQILVAEEVGHWQDANEMERHWLAQEKRLGIRVLEPVEEHGWELRFKMREWLTEYAGERCQGDPKLTEGCACCESWRAFDVMFESLVDADCRINDVSAVRVANVDELVSKLIGALDARDKASTKKK